MRTTGWLVAAWMGCVAFSPGCQGAIGANDGARGGKHNDSASGSGSSANGTGGTGDDPTDGAGASGQAGDGSAQGSQPPRFVCDDPATRGLGQLAMRRLTRDELMHSFAAVLGDEVMSDDAVTSAASQIPAEAPGDLVASFQNGQAFDHVEGLLLTAQAAAAAVARDPDASERVLGACASTADRACAQSFLDTTALRLLRRPLPDARRESLLTGFDAEGAGSAGMQWLLARLMQAPEAVFQLELPRQTCTDSAAASDAMFAWDDESVFFAPLSGGQVGPEEELTENGWYVWEIPGTRVATGYAELSIDALATSADDVPLELDVNLNDLPLLPGITLAAGQHTLKATVAIAAGSNVKVGVQLKNAAAGRSLALRTLTLGAGASTPECAEVPAHDGLYEVDDWSVASRLAFALTGEAPDQELLDAAARGELRDEDQVRPHAERLIATPAARRQLEAVLDAWLNLHAIPTPHPAIAALAGIDPAGLADEARQELLDYATYEILDNDADTTTLMSAPVGFPRSERMATLYGSEQASGDEPVELPNGHGGMLLRIAPLLSGKLSSSPILRGVYVRKRILCDVLPSPDFSIVNSRLKQFEAEDRTALSTRAAVTEITSEGACPACHTQINPIGFTLESFDPLGLPRSEEIVFDADGDEVARHPIDSHVTAANLEPGLPDELSGATDLNQALADSAKVRGCIAERLYTFARLRPAAPADACALSEVEQWLRDGGSIEQAWLRAVVNRELFVRQVAQEVTP